MVDTKVELKVMLSSRAPIKISVDGLATGLGLTLAVLYFWEPGNASYTLCDF